MEPNKKPIVPQFSQMWHGGDYNPDQWLSFPEIIDEDFRLFPLAGANVVSIGIFAWTRLEPEEGHYDFSWLDSIMDRLAQKGMKAILATPSGARPAWMSHKYPEVLRVQTNRTKQLHGFRHNHCFTSPIYRKKTQEMNTQLAQRYKDHPALLLWHVSNEYGGDCHCDLCQQAFRNWLQNRYDHDLEKLNQAWWTDFWSHRYTDWSQIESPSPQGEPSHHGLVLDWKRFTSDQTIDFYRSEIEPLKKITPQIPVTANLMGTYGGINYWDMAKYMDVVSWDNYPNWHSDYETTIETASRVSFVHDIYRNLKKDKPWLLMESTPSLINWMQVNRLKKPGMHKLSSLQAVAHGSDSVLYFQWRKGRGSCEKFHGAVVDHVGHEHTRVFKDVTEVGEVLKKLTPVVGTLSQAQVAVIYDWENSWGIEALEGITKTKREYEKTCVENYRPFWKQGVTVDVIESLCDFSSYKVVIAPMLYMIRPGVAERLLEFVQKGGTLVTTYLTGMVNENDLCFLGGFPGPLKPATGIWAEEIDTLWDSQSNKAVSVKHNSLGLKGTYKIETLCELVQPDEQTEVLAVYGEDFYAGKPVLTRHKYGQGQVFHIAARTESSFLMDFYTALVKELKLETLLQAPLPEGVTVQQRSDGVNQFLFVMNFSEKAQKVVLDKSKFTDLENNTTVTGKINLPVYGIRILKRLKE